MPLIGVPIEIKDNHTKLKVFGAGIRYFYTKHVALDSENASMLCILAGNL